MDSFGKQLFTKPSSSQNIAEHLLSSSNSSSRLYPAGAGRAENDLGANGKPLPAGQAAVPLSRRGSRDDAAGAQASALAVAGGAFAKTGHDIAVTVEQNSLLPLVLGFLEAGLPVSLVTARTHSLTTAGTDSPLVDRRTHPNRSHCRARRSSCRRCRHSERGLPLGHAAALFDQWWTDCRRLDRRRGLLLCKKIFSINIYTCPSPRYGTRVRFVRRRAVYDLRRPAPFATRIEFYFRMYQQCFGTVNRAENVALLMPVMSQRKENRTNSLSLNREDSPHFEDLPPRFLKDDP